MLTELGTLVSKNAKLQDRIEQLEAIVTSTDFELSLKILGAKQELSLNEINGCPFTVDIRFV